MTFAIFKEGWENTVEVSTIVNSFGAPLNAICREKASPSTMYKVEEVPFKQFPPEEVPLQAVSSN